MLIPVILMLFIMLSGKNGVIVIVEVDASGKYQVIQACSSGAYYKSLLFNLKEPLRTEATDLLFSDLGISILDYVFGLELKAITTMDPNNFNWKFFDFAGNTYQIWNMKQAENRSVNMFMVDEI
ncbi:MAG: hypothetical protein QXP96_03515 [Thermoproteota archaeon]